MSTQQLPARDHGKPVLGSDATFVGVGPCEQPNDDRVRADDFGLLLSDRRLQDLRIVFIATSVDGDDCVAWCNLHKWGSIPGPITIATNAVCPQCHAEAEVAARRKWIIAHCGMNVWLHLLRSVERESW